MKSLEELKAIRNKMQGQVGLRAEDHNHTRVVVGMATCGIASGAKTGFKYPVQSGTGKRPYR